MTGSSSAAIEDHKSKNSERRMKGTKTGTDSGMPDPGQNTQ